MTDLVERLNGLRLKAFHNNADKNLYFVALSRAFQNGDLVAATALEAKDKELAALRERVKELERDIEAKEVAAKSYYQNYRDEEARAETAERVFDDILNELGCERDNEAALEAIATLRRERDEAREAINAIDKIVHTPTPGNEKAQRHFQRDFDAIRKLAAPFRAARAITGERT